MLAALMIAAALSGSPPDVLSDAIEHYYRSVDTYSLTILSHHADGDEQIRYYYMKPGFVRMEFLHPHRGAVLIYSPVTRRVRLWPMGEGNFPRISLDPANPLIRSARGQHVDRSDVGALLENVLTLQSAGKTGMLDEARIGGHRTQHLTVTGDAGYSVAGVHGYELWLDRANLFPLKVISRDQHDAVIETVTMENIRINVALPEALFDPR